MWLHSSCFVCEHYKTLLQLYQSRLYWRSFAETKLGWALVHGNHVPRPDVFQAPNGIIIQVMYISPHYSVNLSRTFLLWPLESRWNKKHIVLVFSCHLKGHSTGIGKSDWGYLEITAVHSNTFQSSGYMLNKSSFLFWNTYWMGFQWYCCWWHSVTRGIVWSWLTSQRELGFLTTRHRCSCQQRSPPTV